MPLGRAAPLLRYHATTEHGEHANHQTTWKHKVITNSCSSMEVVLTPTLLTTATYSAVGLWNQCNMNLFAGPWPRRVRQSGLNLEPDMQQLVLQTTYEIELQFLQWAIRATTFAIIAAIAVSCSCDCCFLLNNCNWIMKIRVNPRARKALREPRGLHVTWDEHLGGTIFSNHFSKSCFFVVKYKLGAQLWSQFDSTIDFKPDIGSHVLHFSRILDSLTTLRWLWRPSDDLASF